MQYIELFFFVSQVFVVAVYTSVAHVPVDSTIHRAPDFAAGLVEGPSFMFLAPLSRREQHTDFGGLDKYIYIYIQE